MSGAEPSAGGGGDASEIIDAVEVEPGNPGASFLAKVAVALGVAVTVTAMCIFMRWVYFWLLMAAGFGLFISEEALNVWVGISLARTLCLDGSWQSLVSSFSTNASYIISTVLWVYWGVCISDMVPFYLGKLFRQTRASEDIYSKLGISKEKALSVSRAIQKYGNLIGFVERFSIGIRNPTGFLAGAVGVSADCYFAGICCGCLFTLPIQLAVGFLLRERPVVALASVAAVVGIWTVFPYAAAACTALFLYLRQRRPSS